MRFATFLRRCLEFALRGTTKSADTMQILGSLLIPTIGISAILPLLTKFAENNGYDMPDLTADNYAYFLGYALLIWIGVRFFISPYFVWRDEADRGDSLELRLAEPEYLERKWMANHIAETRAKVGRAASLFATRADTQQLWTFKPHEDANSPNDWIDGWMEDFKRAHEDMEAGIEELSYIPGVRDAGHNVTAAGYRLCDAYRNGQEVGEARADLQQAKSELIRILYMK